MADRHVTWKPGGQWVRLNDTDVPEQVVMDGQDVRGGAPDLHVEFWIRDGIPEVSEFRLTAKEGGRGVRTADLRAFQSLDGMAVNAFMRMHRAGRGGLWDEGDYWDAVRDIQGAQADQGTKSRVSRAELETVARTYRGAGRDNPTEQVQLALGYSRRTAERRIQAARGAGLLPPGRRGRP